MAKSWGLTLFAYKSIKQNTMKHPILRCFWGFNGSHMEVIHLPLVSMSCKTRHSAEGHMERWTQNSKSFRSADFANSLELSKDFAENTGSLWGLDVDGWDSRILVLFFDVLFWRGRVSRRFLSVNVNPHFGCRVDPALPFFAESETQKAQWILSHFGLHVGIPQNTPNRKRHLAASYS